MEANKFTIEFNPNKSRMSAEEFRVYQSTVDPEAGHFESMADGLTLITCKDGSRYLLGADGNRLPKVLGNANAPVFGITEARIKGLNC